MNFSVVYGYSQTFAKSNDLYLVTFVYLYPLQKELD
jgi:hypothetical protein